MNIAIAGYGVEGESNYRYYAGQGHRLTIVDEKELPQDSLPENALSITGPGSFEKLQDFDLVVRTAGLSPRKIKTSGKVWSATNEFFAHCPAPIIGVTGTKGKGTTSSLIASILEVAGKKVHLLGNIGVPALDILPSITADDIVVYELSSFQLWDAQISPHVAVVLMIEPEHLDVHTDMQDYIDAKSNITRHQSAGDVTIFYKANQLSAQIASLSKGVTIGYETAQGDDIKINNEVVCQKNETGLRGMHNLENIQAAMLAAWQFTQNIEAYRQAVTSFKGLPHRLEEVGLKNDILIVNDSFSSAPPATVAAMKSFDQPEILIIGGFDRKLSYAHLTDEITKQANIKQIILMGQTRHIIAQELNERGWDRYEIDETGNFSSIVKKAWSYAQPGDVIVLTPGCASFDMFKNFVDRGEQFKKLASAL